MALDRTQAPRSSPITKLNLSNPKISITSNGVQILELHDESTEVIYLEIVLASGRWMEEPFGVGYYASKLLAEGTSKYSSAELALAFEVMGAHLQIAPGLDHISVRLFALKKNFSKSFDLLQHIFQEANFPEKEFEMLRDIRFQEIKNQFARNSQFATSKFQEALFGAKHPYGQISTVDNLKGITIDDVKTYAKNNLWTGPKILLVGNIKSEVDKVSNWIQKLKIDHFRLPQHQLESSKSPILINRQNSTQASVRLGSLTINKHQADIHKLSLTNMLLGGFFGSRLMKNIREKKGLTYGIYSQIAHLNNASYLMVSAEVEKGNSEQVISEIQKEIKKLQSEPPAYSELEVVCNYARGKLLSSIDSTLSLASIFKSQLLFGLTNDYQDKFLQELNEIKPQTISEMASKYMNLDQEVVVA